MSFFQFAKNLAGVGTENAANALTETIVKLAPDAATEAELRTMEQALDAAGEEIAKWQRTAREDEHTYDAIQARYTQMMSAAEHLQDQATAETDPAKKTGLETSLTALLSQIEKIAPELDADKKHVEDTHALLADLNAAYQQKATQLTQAKANLTDAKKDIARAKVEERRSTEMADAERVRAGLTTKTDNINVALGAMQRVAQQSRDHAAANNLKTEALKGSRTADEDPNIVAAMAAVSGGPGTATVADRLAALKARQ